MRVLYYDCFSGISGDMNLGAMLDLGVSQDHLRAALSTLCLDDAFTLDIFPVSKHGIHATKVLITTQEHSHYSLADVRVRLANSGLSLKTRTRALKILELLANTQHPVQATQEVLFSLKTLLYSTGAAFCLESLGVDGVYTSPVELGGGFEGTTPTPTPATLALLKGFPVTLGRAPFETTTASGAAILASFAASFAPLPPLHVEKVGYGAGERELQIPNLLRVMLGYIEPQITKQKEVLLETNIDDMSPERLAYAQEKLYQAGALDVFSTPIGTKKNRLGTMLSVLCTLEKESLLTHVIFRETSSIGLRRHEVTKIALLRETRIVQTPYGNVEVKCVTPPGASLRFKAEFDTCRALAAKHGVPIQTIYDAVAVAMESS